MKLICKQLKGFLHLHIVLVESQQYIFFHQISKPQMVMVGLLPWIDLPILLGILRMFTRQSPILVLCTGENLVAIKMYCYCQRSFLAHAFLLCSKMAGEAPFMKDPTYFKLKNLSYKTRFMCLYHTWDHWNDNILYRILFLKSIVCSKTHWMKRQWSHIFECQESTYIRHKMPCKRWNFWNTLWCTSFCLKPREDVFMYSPKLILHESSCWIRNFYDEAVKSFLTSIIFVHWLVCIFLFWYLHKMKNRFNSKCWMLRPTYQTSRRSILTTY